MIRTAAAAMIGILFGAGISACGGSGSATGTVSGTINGFNGSPILGAAVALLGTDHLALTDSAGKFRIDGVAAGVYTAQAGAPGFQLARLDGVVVNKGSNSLIVVSLAPTPPPPIGTGTVTGLVKLADGAEPAGGLVQLEGTNFSAVTASGGAFLLAGVIPGRYTLTVQHSGYTPASITQVNVTADAQSDVGLVTLARAPGGGSGY